MEVAQGGQVWKYSCLYEATIEDRKRIVAEGPEGALAIKANSAQERDYLAALMNRLVNEEDFEVAEEEKQEELEED